MGRTHAGLVHVHVLVPVLVPVPVPVPVPVLPGAAAMGGGGLSPAHPREWPRGRS